MFHQGILSKISDENMENIKKGKHSLTLHPQKDHMEGEHVVTIFFNNDKTLKRFKKNLSSGKSVRINSDEASIYHHESGGSIWGRIGHFFNNAGNTIKSGFQKIAPVARQVVNSPITKSIVKGVTPVLSTAVNGLVTGAVGAENPALGAVAGNLAGQATTAGLNKYTGSGIRRLKSVKRGGSFAPLGGSLVQKRVGKGNVKLGVDPTSYMGIHQPGLESQQPTTQELKDKMSRVRSFIGQGRLT